MCRGCEAHKLTINILQSQNDRLIEQNRDLSHKLDVLLGIGPVQPVPVESETYKEFKPLKGTVTWSEMRTKLEAHDSKLLRELQKLDEA
jgi:hypothetical protein